MADECGMVANPPRHSQSPVVLPGAVLAPTPFSMMFTSTSYCAFQDSRTGIGLNYGEDGKLVNLRMFMVM